MLNVNVLLYNPDRFKRGYSDILQSTYYYESFSQNPAPVPRTMQVLLAPHVPSQSLTYYIDSGGVHGISNEEYSNSPSTVQSYDASCNN